MLCKRRHADTPIRPYVSPSRPIFIATLWAGAGWLFFRVARSTRMTQIWVLRSRLEKQPTDLRQYTCYFGDRTLTSTEAKMAPRERREHCRIPGATHRQERMTSRSAEVELLRNLRPNWNPLRMRLRILPCIRPGRPQRRSDSFSWVEKLALVFRISIGINPNYQIRCSARCSRQSGQHAQAAAYRQK